MTAAKRWSLRCAWTVLLCSTLHAPLARAADPQPYRVQFVSTGRDEIDSTLKATSQLQTLSASAPVNPYGLIARARGDVDRLRTVLESFGYYQGSVSITLDGLALDAPRLGDALTELPKGTDAHVRIAAVLGPLYHLGRIDVEGALPAGMRDQLGLAPGQPAVASEVLAAGTRLETALQDRGYAFATVAAPVAHEDPQKHLLDLTLHVVPGPEVKVGEIRFEGLKHTREAVLRRRIRLHSGEIFNAAAVDRARRELLNLGIFTTVSVELGSAPDSLGRVPITFRVTERPRRTVGVSGAYSSDLGSSGGLSWDDRNLFGNAEELDLSATMINLGGTATTGLGYDATAKYILPDFGHRDQSLQFAVTGLRQSLLAYDQSAVTAGVTLSRRLSSVWNVNAGVSAQRESDVQESVTRDYTLVATTLSALYDSTNLSSPLDDPAHGTRGSLNLSPTLSLGQPNATFLIMQASLSHYIDLGGLLGSKPGRSVLALRVMSGVALGASEFGLPPDQRFYAGGSGTVRGYRYQSVGPQFNDTNPVGGTAMDAVNIELRQRIGRNFGAVIFADGGGVSEGTNPFAVSRNCTAPAASSTSPLPRSTTVSCIGVGAGVRYYTPIGPVRLDFAVPTVRRQNDDRFEVYVGLGQAF